MKSMGSMSECAAMSRRVGNRRSRQTFASFKEDDMLHFIIENTSGEIGRKLSVATVEQTALKVQRLLTGPMKLKVQLQGDLIAVEFSDASTRVNIQIFDWGVGDDGEPRTLVRMASPLLRSVNPSPELFEWAAREGANYFFGHVLAVDDKNDAGKLVLFFMHTLLGDYLDEAELSAALWAVLRSANDLDEELEKKFGGKRWVDR